MVLRETNRPRRNENALLSERNEESTTSTAEGKWLLVCSESLRQYYQSQQLAVVVVQYQTRGTHHISLFGRRN